MLQRIIAGSAMLASLAGCRAKVDVAREADALLATDRAWSQAIVTGKSVDSVVTFWTDDARVAMTGQPLVKGKAAILEMVKGTLTIPGFQISWIPESAVVSESGDLGYTFGTNSVTAPDAKGKLVTEVGRYLTVWRKGADGRWRCVMDYSTPGPA